jgi:hypothetical protein
MRGSVDTLTLIFLGFIFMILFVGLIVVGVSGKNLPYSTKTNPEEIHCKTDAYCLNNPKEKGNKCLLIYPGDFVPFCGCLTTEEDCKVGSCGSNNKCS